MTSKSRSRINAVIFAIFPLLILLSFNAQAIVLNTLSAQPSGHDETGTNNNHAEDELASILGVTFLELYKSDPKDSDEWAFADEYDTVFFNSTSEPEYATISYVGTTPINPADYSILYALAKDGNHDPAWYAWDLLDTPITGSNWNGTDDLEFQALWLNVPGSISHISLLGVLEEDPQPPTGVPVPATLALLSLGIAGIGYRRLKHNRTS